MLSLNAKSVIFDFLPTEILIKNISKLSKFERKSLVTQNKNRLKSRGKLFVKHLTINSILGYDYNFFENPQFYESINYLLSITVGLRIDMAQNAGFKFRQAIIPILEIENKAFDLGKKVEICRHGVIQEGRNNYLFCFDLKT